MHKKSLKNSRLGKAWKKVKYFLNEDESFLSLLANIAIAFVFIKFIVYPGLGFFLGTGFPIVAVVSGSMEHEGDFDEWWNSAAILDSKKSSQNEFYESYNITKDDFKDFPFSNGFNTGDIMLLIGESPEDIEVGEVIVFTSSRPEPVIHRVIEKNIKDEEIVFRTKGDHNPTTYFFEAGIDEEQILGVAKLRIPYLGWVKIGFVKAIQCIIRPGMCFS